MPTLKTQRFPDEFEGLLSAAGRRILRGRNAKARGALSQDTTWASAGLLHARWVHDGAEVLKRAFGDLLVEQHRATPPADAGEPLPPVSRMLVAPQTAAVAERAGSCGLQAMLNSESLRAFVGVLAGRPVSAPGAIDVLAFRRGDCAGPHTRHATRAASAVELHLSLCTSGVTRQLFISEREGHLGGVVDLTAAGAVTVCRLPTWRATSPLETKHLTARRWVVGAAFDFADEA